jgi:hypothetical protein
MNIEVTSMCGESTYEDAACTQHPIARVEYVQEVTEDAVDKRQGEIYQSDEFGDKVDEYTVTNAVHQSGEPTARTADSDNRNTHDKVDALRGKSRKCLITR